MNFNSVTLMGNLTREPELKWLPSGSAVCNFSIAINDKYKKDEQWVDNVSYFDIVVFGRQAETSNEYLSKGRPVLVEGKLQQRRWEANDGTKRNKVEIVASNVIFLGASESKTTGFSEVNEDDVPF